MPVVWVFLFIGALLAGMIWWVVASGLWPQFLTLFVVYVILRLWYVYRRKR